MLNRMRSREIERETGKIQANSSSQLARQCFRRRRRRSRSRSSSRSRVRSRSSSSQFFAAKSSEKLCSMAKSALTAACSHTLTYNCADSPPPPPPMERSSRPSRFDEPPESLPTSTAIHLQSQASSMACVPKARASDYPFSECSSRSSNSATRHGSGIKWSRHTHTHSCDTRTDTQASGVEVQRAVVKPGRHQRRTAGLKTHAQTHSALLGELDGPADSSGGSTPDCSSGCLCTAE